MTAVEVCPICDIAGCRHIRERVTPSTQLSAALQVPEVQALVRALDIIADPSNWYKSDDSETAWRGRREPDHIAEIALAALKGPQT